MALLSILTYFKIILASRMCCFVHRSAPFIYGLENIFKFAMAFTKKNKAEMVKKMDEVG